MKTFVLSGGERVLRKFRPSAVVILPSLILSFFAIFIPSRFFTGYTLPSLVSSLWKLWVAGWLVWLLWKFLRWRLERYFVTTQRLIVIVHLRPLEQRVEETPLDRILNISIVMRGSLDWLFGLGTLAVHAVGLNDPLLLKDISGAADMSRFLWQESRKRQKNFQSSAALPEGLMQSKQDQWVE